MWPQRDGEVEFILASDGAARSVLIINLQVSSCINCVRFVYAVNYLSCGFNLRTTTEQWSSSITIN